MSNIIDVISWKFNDQPGMCCAEDENGVMRIVKFPGGIPNQATQDGWTAEYNAWIASGGLDDKKANDIVQDFQNSPALKVLVNALMNGDFVPGTQYTPAQLKAIAKKNQ